MTLDNLQYALYLNNCILLDKIKAIKDTINGIQSTDIDELKKLLDNINNTELINIKQLIADLDIELSNHTSNTVIHVTQNDKDLWNATLQNAKDYAKRLFDGVTSFTIEIVDTLPTEDIKLMTIYFIRNNNDNESDYYSEYMYINGKWEIIGSTFVNLAPYLLKEDFEKIIANYVTKEGLNNELKNYVTSTKLIHEYAKLTDLHDHVNKSILDKLSEINGILSYNGNSLQTELKLSSEEYNAIVKNIDGLYVKDYSETIENLQKQVSDIQKEMGSIGDLIDVINRTVI